MVTFAIALMGIMEPTVKLVIIQYPFKFVIDINNCTTRLFNLMRHLKHHFDFIKVVRMTVLVKEDHQAHANQTRLIALPVFLGIRIVARVM